MTHIYYLLLLVITGLGSSLMTMYIPKLKGVITRYKARLKRPKHNTELRLAILESEMLALRKGLNKKINTQIDKKLKEILND